MFDAYAVAIKLKLKDELSGVMGLINKQLMQSNQHVSELHSRLEKLGGMWRNSMMVTGAGLGMAMTLKAATNEAVRYEQQLNKLKALNLDARFGAGATAGLEQQALAIAKSTKGTTTTEALRLVTEAQAITGSVEHTKELVPVLAKMRFAMESYMAGQGKGEGHGASAERQFGDVIKAMEMRGLMRDFSEEKLMRMSDLFVKNYVASGGMVKPSDFLAMLKTGGVAGKSVNEDFMFALGHIMQEKGGNRSGTQLMSLYQNMVAGRSTQQVAEHLMQLGLLNAGGVHYGKTGHITKTDFGALKAAEVMQANPLQYLNEYILPALAKKGINIEDQKQVIPQLAQLASNRTGADFLAQLYLERGQIANYMVQAKGAMGLNALDEQGGKSATGEQMDLMAKVNQLELDFGQAALPLLKSLLEQAIPLVKSLGGLMDRHPGALSAIAVGLAGIAASMAMAGPLMLLNTGFKAASLILPSLGRGLAGANFAMLGTVGALAAVGVASYKLGTALNDGLISPLIQKLSGGNSQSLGDWIGNMTHDSVAEHDAKWREQMKATLAAKQKAVQVNTTLNIDGRKVAQAVSQHQARDMGTGTNGGGFDNGLALAMPGAHR